MIRIQIQLPDALYAHTRRFAAIREISMAELCRNSLELFLAIHPLAEDGLPSRRWEAPVCRSTGLKTDPFAAEDWRERIYAADQE